jgi:hypothetical protein
VPGFPKNEFLDNFLFFANKYYNIAGEAGGLAQMVDYQKTNKLKNPLRVKYCWRNIHHSQHMCINIYLYIMLYNIHIFLDYFCWEEVQNILEN